MIDPPTATITMTMMICGKMPLIDCFITLKLLILVSGSAYKKPTGGASNKGHEDM
jgi:hypothetical protein